MTGTTFTSTGLQLLTGQQVSSTLSIAPGFSIDSTTYQWNAPGDTFYTYNQNAASHQLVLLTDAPAYKTSPTFSFYDKSKESVTVTCTATVVCPNGPPGTRLSVTASSPPIAVQKPTVTSWGINTGSPGPQALMPTSGVQPGLQGSTYTMFADEIWGPITITVPPLGTTNVGGLGCIAQVVTNNGNVATRTPLNGASATFVDVVKNSSGKYIAEPTPELDEGFPYPHGYNLNAQGQMDPNAPTTSSQWTIPQSGTNQSGYSGDEPTQIIFPAGNTNGDNGGNNWTQSVFGETFNTYVMYQPPGGVWVPLQMITWRCSLTAGPAAGGQIIDPYNNAQWGVSASQFSGGHAANTSTPPSWVYVSKPPLSFGPISK